jgi:hypothetical protein
LASINESDARSFLIIIDFDPRLEPVQKGVAANTVATFGTLFSGHTPTVFLIGKSLK